MYQLFVLVNHYQRLDDYWTSIRLTKMQVPAEHMLLKKPLMNSNSNALLLSEALGLKINDLKLDQEIPYLNITPNSARRLKTKSSERQIPLIGSSLWAAKQILLNVKGEFAFPHYTVKDYC